VATDDSGRFEELFTAIDEGYCLCEIVVDDDGRAVDYRFIETNPLFESMTGLVDAVGHTALELVPDLEAEWIETYARAGLGRERIRFQQGSAAMGRWFDVFTMPVGRHGRFAIVFKDETQKREAELAAAASEARYRLLAETERDKSLRLQHALLPRDVVTDEHVQIAARYSAAGLMDEVGGDWYDTHRWPTGEVGAMVGDVVGHNLDAAATMGHLRAGCAALASHIPADPVAWLGALEECAHGPNGTEFVTAASAVLDVESSSVSFSAAGHPPALLVRSDGSTAWLDAAQSPPLGRGVAPTSPRTAQRVRVADGDMVVLYSDGLVERRAEPLDIGLERLRVAAAEVARVDAEQVVDHLMEALVDRDTQADDVVVVACRISLSNPPDHRERPTTT
jgi:serine phosphatase RsbU (regulator of sigma subunit)